MRTRWIRRHGSKSTRFWYSDPSGQAVRDPRQLERIIKLRIPPAWRDVHIAMSERAAVQAWGIDAKGRKQYRYHERAVQRGEQRKYYRVRRLAKDLPRVRRLIQEDFARGDFARDAVIAAMLRLISEGYFRSGGERYARENKTFGIATLRKKHVRVEGDAIFFSFVGKLSRVQRKAVVDRDLAAFIGRLLEQPGQRLFRCRDESGWADLTAREVNEYLQRRTGVRYNAKDFRTWGGTLRMATVLAELGSAPETRRGRHKNVVTAIRLVAAELGNTPAICRKSYVHPIVIARYERAGETIALAPGRRRRRSWIEHSPEERALLSFLDHHFPERRRRTRPEELVAA
ncbi:MAG: DNA topoisomerase IB [Chloroflexota bacterium]|nr:DNA topoisomerase IB [Chloroflexota bacterium]